MSTINPLFTLDYVPLNAYTTSTSCNRKGSLVSSVCFISYPVITSNNHNNNSNQQYIENDYDDHDDIEIIYQKLKSRSRIFNNTLSSPDSQSDSTTAYATSLSFVPPDCDLPSTLLLSTHVDGSSWIWDLSRRRILEPLISTREHRPSGPGLTLRRLYTNTTGFSNYNRIPTNPSFLYQTRDDKGTITLHDVQNDSCMKIVSTISSYSKTFCLASPLLNETLIAMPSGHESFVTIRDWRMNPTSRPVAYFHGAGSQKRDQKDGMITSLSLSRSRVTGSNEESITKCVDTSSIYENIYDFRGGDNIVLSCGMESGVVYFHDLKMLRDKPYMIKALKVDTSSSDDDLGQDNILAMNTCSVTTGKDPVLALDSYPSYDMCDMKQSCSTFRNNRNIASVVTVAGLAGDKTELLDLPVEERGTVALIKASFPFTSPPDNNTCHARTRSRVNTCHLSDDINQNGKPGVSACRFRPDGRIFAVGGWDYRVRIYSRTTAKLLSILKGSYESSVSCLDWVDDGGDLSARGVLASGFSDGKICIWSTGQFN